LAARVGITWGNYTMDQGTRRGIGLATIVSLTALATSTYSFYTTVWKQAELRLYPPPLVYMYREGFRDVFAISMTISNDGARRGTVLSFDLEIEHLGTKKKQRFQNLHFGASPRESVRLFTPMTVPGSSSVSDVVLFHALETGSFVETTGGVELPLRLTLRINQDTSGDWFSPAQPAPVTFDMTAYYIASHNDMERGRPTQLHDNRWVAGHAKSAAEAATETQQVPAPQPDAAPPPETATPPAP